MTLELIIVQSQFYIILFSRVLAFEWYHFCLVTLSYFKAFLKKIKNAAGRRDWERVDRVRTTKPTYRFDHIVLERYPSFHDALRDMDDALCIIFMFARLPKSSTVPAEMIKNCRRILMEWTNYYIHSQSIREKGFIFF